MTALAENIEVREVRLASLRALDEMVGLETEPSPAEGIRADEAPAEEDLFPEGRRSWPVDGWPHLFTLHFFLRL
jgi:hypothetical protein